MPDLTCATTNNITQIIITMIPIQSSILPIVPDGSGKGAYTNTAPIITKIIPSIKSPSRYNLFGFHL